MNETLLAFLFSILVLVASIVSVHLALSVAITEIAIGVVAGNLLGVHTTPWIDFLAGFGSILLTFLAGAEVDVDVLKARLKESLLIGVFSFLVPFICAWAFVYFVAGWTWRAGAIAGTALSTTSLAVVYAVLVETGLTRTELGKIIMASCFVTDIGTALALSVIFAEASIMTLVFVVVSVAVMAAAPLFCGWFFTRYGRRVIEPDVKAIFALLFGFMALAQVGKSHAVLPVFVLGLVLSRLFNSNRELQRKLRVIAFGLVTPFFFVKGGMNVSLSALWTGIGLFAVLFALKVGAKFVGVLPFAFRFLSSGRMYTTLLMSTGLTFGTISSMYGLQAGYIDREQFSILVAVVIATAIIPTFIAQRWFQPPMVFEEYKLDSAEATDGGVR